MERTNYQKVFDERKRRVRGLWKRNGWFYARLAVVDDTSGRKSVRRVKLDTARTVAEARIAMHDLLKARRDEALPVLRRSPRLADYWREYFEFHEQVRDAKRPSSVKRERCASKAWLEHLGELRVADITKAHLNGYLYKRQAAGIAAATINRDVTALRNVFNRAVEDGYLKASPLEKFRLLKVNQRQRALVTAGELERLFKAAEALPLSGRMLADVLRLMCFCGSRIAETLRLRWSDVHFDHRQIVIGADGLAKNGKPRVVDFNAALEVHLREMASRRPGDSAWLFPSPRAGGEDLPIVNLHKAFYEARACATLGHFGFHDSRHYFISQCVMSGIDFMTIARWVGHQDGGVLIGKVYGHLSNEHARRQAERLAF